MYLNPNSVHRHYVKANQRDDPQTDRKKARKWEKEHSSKQIHLHQPTFVDGTAITNGTNNGTTNGTELSSKEILLQSGRRKQINYTESSLKEVTDSDYEDKPKRVNITGATLISLKLND
ncbi:hypothetical protein F8M41_013047 [Gigaspora margarita]|uniref:Uncharacterized protein n=1 Tax=Gigaspora margarita TaxID=4874 RepID=A0A8H3WX74_GIGMA|nr:hypothetical protein F8M41_013047 [Gigaspora margarita]